MPPLPASATPVDASAALPDMARVAPSPPPPQSPPRECGTAPAAAASPKRPKPDGPKRSDPFQFGNRLLLPGDDVFDFNAWDHVDVDDEYAAHAAAQIAKQRAAPVSAFDRARFNAQPARWWNTFYANNREHFFKDRKWLAQEFPVLAALAAADAGPAAIVELGCGAGNTLFPVLQLAENPRLRLHGCDFAPKAVDLVRSHPLFVAHEPAGRVAASVYDLAQPDTLPDGVAAASVDVVIMVFVFSALAPAQWPAAVANVRRMLRPGGKVLFRDYGRGDLAQVRFKAGRYMEENFYIRGDGTRVYFFEEDELKAIFARGGKDENGAPVESAKEAPQPASSDGSKEEADVEEKDDVTEKRDETEETQKEDEREGEQKSELEGNARDDGWMGGFDIESFGVDKRLIVNRKRQIKMYRRWLQATFVKR